MNTHAGTLRRQRDLGEIIGDVFDLYSRHFLPLVIIAALSVPIGVGGALLRANGSDSEPLTSLLAVLEPVVALLATAALVAALAQIDEGGSPRISEAYAVAVDRFISVVGAWLRVVFHVVLFAITIIGIPWAIQRLVRWLFIEQAIILDGANAKAALSKSADAVIGSWWRTLGISIAITLLVGAPAWIFFGVVSLGNISPLVQDIALALFTALVSPFVVTASTLLYFDLQARKESYATIHPA